MPDNTRLAYLDWLRIMAIIGVLVFHAVMPFVAEWGWHIKNKETSNLLLEMNFWLSRFRMPLLFFISGTVSYFMMQRRNSRQFIGLRARRLLIPLLFGMLVIVPPQVYMERLTQGFSGNYLDFYPSIFKGVPYPKGNLSWHHLWFILYLFLYDVIGAPFFSWLISAKGKLFRQKISWLARGRYIYLFMIPATILYCAFSLQYPATDDLIHDGFYFTYWLLFLLAGFLCITQPLLMGSLERNRRFSLGLAFLSIIAINYFRWNNVEPWDLLSHWRADWRTYAYLGLYPITAWSWVFTAIGYGKKYLNKKHRVLDYVNQAVYPFYVLHQTVIVIIAYYVVQTTESIGDKYLFTMILSFGITVTLYHLFVRPFALMRFLFGMKPRTRKKHSTRSRQEEITDEQTTGTMAGVASI